MRLPKDFAWLVPIVALFVATFAVNTAENIVAGLLPGIASDLRVDIPTAGQLITGYALGVAVAGPLLALVTTGVSRRNLLLVTIGIFVLGNVICAISTNYAMLMVARLLTAACQGLFFGVAMIIATQLAPEGRQTTALSLVVAGVTVASIAGVPIGTAVGNAYGWHMAFWAIAVAGAVAAGVLALLIPPGLRQERLSGAQILTEVRAAVRPVVLLCYAIIVFFMMGAIVLIAYMVPLLTQVSGVSMTYVPWVLFGMGATGFFGNLLGGRLGDWNPVATMVGILTLCIGLLFVMAQVVTNTWPMLIVLWTLWFVGFGFVAPIQGRILKEASDAPNFASTLISTAFNVGIACGAAIGGAAIAWGWGYRSLPWLDLSSECVALGGTLLLATVAKQSRVASATA